VLKKAAAAHRPLAELKGAAAVLPNPRLLVDGIVLQEARLSSEVEQIVTTSDELYRAAAGGTGGLDPHAKEVVRYREALWHGYEKLKSRPLGMNLFVELMQIIKGTSAGIRSVPGTRILGAVGEVVYTPPEGKELIREKLGNLEHFLHADDDRDPLVKMAAAHYQFEAIHPFTDGNGRTGRIINILFLIEKHLLDLPVLYLSRYIIEHKREYYDRLRAVTEGVGVGAVDSVHAKRGGGNGLLDPRTDCCDRFADGGNGAAHSPRATQDLFTRSRRSDISTPLL
jgi:Fic family protein